MWLDTEENPRSAATNELSRQISTPFRFASEWAILVRFISSKKNNRYAVIVLRKLL